MNCLLINKMVACIFLMQRPEDSLLFEKNTKVAFYLQKSDLNFNFHVPVSARRISYLVVQLIATMFALWCLPVFPQILICHWITQEQVGLSRIVGDITTRYEPPRRAGLYHWRLIDEDGGS